MALFIDVIFVLSMRKSEHTSTKRVFLVHVLAEAHTEELLIDENKLSTTVSQLDKCLKFKSIQGDRNDCTLDKITPLDAVNFRHLSSCDTAENVDDKT